MIIAVTPGDPNGIGPEVLWKCIKKEFFPKDLKILCVGAVDPFVKLGCPLIYEEPKNNRALWIFPAPKNAPQKKLNLSGFQSGWSIKTAANLVLSNRAAALVTGPIHKEHLLRGGYEFPGHTEFLAHLCAKKDVTMMLANPDMRVALVTTHIAIKNVAKNITRSNIRKTVLNTFLFLKNTCKIKTPKIAVLALNPHAGDRGLFGKEEQEIITPELQHLKNKLGSQVQLTGPHPADSFFANGAARLGHKREDAIIAMYHDQGLIPIKQHDFLKTVNITLGLPMIRTSVDHGVGFDIAGKGIARHESMAEAIRLAYDLAKKRGK